MMAMETFEKWALHAYADGELDGDDSRAVEKLLTNDEQARETLAAIHLQRSALRKEYDGALGEQLPSALLKMVAISRRRKRFAIFSKWALAAGLVGLMIGVTGGWLAGHSMAVAETLPDRALNAFSVFATDPNHATEVSASDKDNLDHWLVDRIGAKFNIPDLSDKGYALVGGRMLAEQNRPAGLLIYEDAAKNRLVIYVAANPAKNELPMAVTSRGKLVSCFWVESDLVYALAGEQTAKVMLPLAQEAHVGFDKDDG